MRPAAALAAILATLVLAPPATAQNSGRVPDAPLDFDPAKPEPVVGWWTNDHELLRLEPNGAYQMWPTQDRFQRPSEVGAWRRSNYVYFDLEPYRAKPGTRFKVQLVKDKGETMIERAGMGHFRRATVPPRVFGDEAIGAWTAPNEQLLILDNGRYEYRRLNAGSGISQHSGIWRTDGEQVFLAPDTPAVDTIRLQGVKDPEGRWELATASGRFTKLRPEDPPVPAAAKQAPAPHVPAPGASPAPAPPAAPGGPAAPAPKPPANG